MTADDAHSLGQERTPEGEPIDTYTLWLDFDDGEECAISLDLTGWNAAMRRVADHKPGHVYIYTDRPPCTRADD